MIPNNTDLRAVCFISAGALCFAGSVSVGHWLVDIHCNPLHLVCGLFLIALGLMVGCLVVE